MHFSWTEIILKIGEIQLIWDGMNWTKLWQKYPETELAPLCYQVQNTSIIRVVLKGEIKCAETCQIWIKLNQFWVELPSAI